MKSFQATCGNPLSKHSTLRIWYMTYKFYFLNYRPSLYHDVDIGLNVPATLVFFIQRNSIRNKYGILLQIIQIILMTGWTRKQWAKLRCSLIDARARAEQRGKQHWTVACPHVEAWI